MNFFNKVTFVHTAKKKSPTTFFFKQGNLPGVKAFFEMQIWGKVLNNDRKSIIQNGRNEG